MMYTAAFFIELFLLFLLSRTLSRLLSVFFYRITHSKRFTIYMLALLYFPGTLIHELAHYCMARILFVPAYKIEFFPKLHGDSVKLGSVTIASTDFFRRLLIGTAPFFIGTSLLLGILYFAVKENALDNWVIIALLVYAVFEIGNTMFSSRKDMEGAAEFLAIVLLMAILIFLFDIKIPFLDPNLLFSNVLLMKAFEKAAYFLLLPLGIDGIFIILLKTMK